MFILNKEVRALSHGIAVLIVIAIIVIAGLGAFASNALNASRTIISSSSSTSISTSPTTTNANSCANAQESYSDITRRPLNYTQLNALLSMQLTSSCLDEVQNTIFIYTGYNWCIMGFYVLPNETLVNWYEGVSNSTQTCV